MATTVQEMASIINDLPNNKSAGPDGISREHFKYAGVKLRVLLSAYFGDTCSWLCAGRNVDFCDYSFSQR